MSTHDLAGFANECQNTRRSLEAMRAWLDQIAKDAVNDWFARQCADPFVRLYLYYRTSTVGSDGQLKVSEDRPNPDFELASPQRLCPSWSKEQAFIRIRDWIQRLPILDPQA